MPTVTVCSREVCFHLPDTHLFPYQERALAHWPPLEGPVPRSRWVPLSTGSNSPESRRQAVTRSGSSLSDATWLRISPE